MKNEPRLLLHIIEGLAVSFGSAVISAFALPLVLLVVRGWVWLYTVSLPAPVRERRRQEIESELAEQIRDERSEGYFPHAIGLHMVARLIYGMLDDLCWLAGEQWARLVVVWTFLVIWIWARFALPRKMRGMPSESAVGLSKDQSAVLFILLLLGLLIFVLSSRKQTEPA